MKLGENLKHDVGYLSVLEFRGNLFPVLRIECLKLTQDPADLGSKKIDGDSSEESALEGKGSDGDSSEERAKTE